MSSLEEKVPDPYGEASFNQEEIAHSQDITFDSGSPGVKKIEAIASSFTPASLTILFVGIFLTSYAYGLDGQTRSVYQVSKIRVNDALVLP